MKTHYLLKTLLLWMVICLPVWAGAEELGFLRLSQMKGDVQFQPKGMSEWLPAAINLPVRSGDRLWVPRDAWAQVETREGNVVRLDADSSLEILAVDEKSLQMYLSEGQAYLNFRGMDDAMLQLDTPVSSIRIYDSSTLNVALAENGNTEISVFRGAVYAENRSGEVRVGAGKMLSMDDGLPILMSLNPPSDWERWNREWDESLANGEESEQYLPPELSGYGRDLSRNGRWVQTREYGYVWTPTMYISADWAPYRHGRWVWIGDDYVWIANEPWGWAPYHYGRWSHISSHGWCWVPPPRNEVYWGPGYVSWVSTATDVAWVPLAPGEIYYGHGNYGPHSANILNVNIYAVIPGRTYRNVHVRNAVSVVHRDAFLRGEYRDMGHRENPFLRERINIGRPRLEPERATMMPIIKDIPREHQAPAHIRSLSERRVNGERHMVRERDRSVFTPTIAPRPLLPTIRMNPDTTKQGEARKIRESGGRREVREDNVSPEQLRERPTSNRNMNRDVIQDAPVRPQVTEPPSAVPVPINEQPSLREEKEEAPAIRGRREVREDNVSPGQLRERPTSNRNMSRDVIQDAPVRPQVTEPPPAVPVPVNEQPSLREEKEAAPAIRGRREVREDNVSPGPLRERPTSFRNMSRDVIQDAPVRPQVTEPPPAVPVPVNEQPALREEKEEAPAIRGRREVQEDNVSPGQLRERPTSNRNMSRDVIQDAPVRPQVTEPPPVAPPAPAKELPAKEETEELKHLQQEQAADKKEAKQEEKEEIREMLKERGMRPRSH